MKQKNAQQRVKFYQTGTHTAGNRLMDDTTRTVQASMDRSNAITSGHRACQGCGEALGARYALDAAMRASKGQLVAVNATGCLEVFTTPYPETSWQIPWLHSLFGNAPAVAAGVAAAMRRKGRSDVKVVAQGGDGGTMDIGFGCLLGMFERNDDVLYFCYDNEAYMNTGVQRSSATPPAARTATTPAVGQKPGNFFVPAKTCRSLPWLITFPMWQPPALLIFTISKQKLPKRWTLKVRATYISWCPVRWGGGHSRAILFASPGLLLKADCFLCLKQNMAKLLALKKSAEKYR